MRMIAQYYGRRYSMGFLRRKSQISRAGTSLLGISEAAEGIGFRTLGARLKWEQLRDEAVLPCIVWVDQVHFVVVYRIKRDKVYVADPAKGKFKCSTEEFLRRWQHNSSAGEEGIALLLTTSPKFYDREDERHSGLSFRNLLGYILPYNKLVFQLALGLLAASILQLIIPFLTQAVVDVGIQGRDLNFIAILLLAQIMLFVGRTGVDIIRSWILLHINTRISISIISDFLIKLMRLPVAYFETRSVGDVMQRIEDHSRIERLLTNQTLSALFAAANLIVFAVVLAWYSLTIFAVFISASILYVLWVVLFLRRRRELDHRRFGISSGNNSMIIELVRGIQAIKLNACEKSKRWEWERLQARLFRYRTKHLALQQYQEGGASFINEGKNIAITFLSAVAVVNGHLTLGAMMAIQYIIGQLNGPVDRLIGFVQTTQDALISMERLNEVHQEKEEEPSDRPFIYSLPDIKDIAIKDLYFTYPGAGNMPVLRDINLVIPEGKMTALVGMSGSGKTTLLKILLKFYPIDSGTIHVADKDFSYLSPSVWRSHCGAVMQDGFIFNDTISRNIAVGEEEPDIDRLAYSAKAARIHAFIQGLPLGYHTKIGSDGTGLSQGQKQRILIARAVYKDPYFLFFDEATNSLDSKNEADILRNLSGFLKDRTVVVVAHRLSTVRTADSIVVLDDGRIVEHGSHDQLIEKNGAYHALVKSQLEVVV